MTSLQHLQRMPKTYVHHLSRTNHRMFFEGAFAPASKSHIITQRMHTSEELPSCKPSWLFSRENTAPAGRRARYMSCQSTCQICGQGWPQKEKRRRSSTIIDDPLNAIITSFPLSNGDSRQELGLKLRGYPFMISTTKDSDHLYSLIPFSLAWEDR